LVKPHHNISISNQLFFSQHALNKDISGFSSRHVSTSFLIALKETVRLSKIRLALELFVVHQTKISEVTKFVKIAKEMKVKTKSLIVKAFLIKKGV
jgi:hypothetical protein